MTGAFGEYWPPTGLGQIDSMINAAVSTRFSTMLTLLAAKESRMRGVGVLFPDEGCQDREAGMAEQGVEAAGVENES